MHLSTYMDLKGLKDHDVAPKIKRSRVSVLRYRTKQSRPEWDVIERIRTFTGGAVTEADWKELAPRARKRAPRKARAA